VDVEPSRIGARIASARRAAGLTQRELAKQLGVTTRSIQNYESGAVVPYKHLRRIETLGRKRAGWLLAGDADDESLATTLEALHGALERHHSLLLEHLETLRRQTELLREQRQAMMKTTRQARR
jgi:transcriptional regulator with XRE-family HTH domain